MPSTPHMRCQFRSPAQFDNPDNIDKTAHYLERFLRSDQPIIGIAQTRGLPRDNH